MAESLLDQVLGPGGSSAPMPMTPMYDPASNQFGPISNSGFPSDPQAISALNSMGNLAPQQQLGAISSYYGYDPGQISALFQQPQPNNPNLGDIGQPIPGGGGPSGQAMSPWQAARNGSMGFGIGSDVGGTGVATQAPSPGMPGYNPGTSLGSPASIYDKNPMSGLYPSGVLPPWLIAQIPQMMAANANGALNRTGYYDTYRGSYIPPMRQPDLTNMWISGRRAPASSGDTSGSVGPFNLDRWGRLNDPYINV